MFNLCILVVTNSCNTCIHGSVYGYVSRMICMYASVCILDYARAKYRQNNKSTIQCIDIINININIYNFNYFVLNNM